MKPFHKLVLTTIHNLQPNAYGVTIRQSVEEERQAFVSYGSIYVALDWLEEHDLIRTFQGEATPEHGGRSKLYAVLTDKGLSEVTGNN